MNISLCAHNCFGEKSIVLLMRIKILFNIFSQYFHQISSKDAILFNPITKFSKYYSKIEFLVIILLYFFIYLLKKLLIFFLFKNTSQNTITLSCISQGMFL